MFDFVQETDGRKRGLPSLGPRDMSRSRPVGLGFGTRARSPRATAAQSGDWETVQASTGAACRRTIVAVVMTRREAIRNATLSLGLSRPSRNPTHRVVTAPLHGHFVRRHEKPSMTPSLFGFPSLGTSLERKEAKPERST
ncbi:hypothetical protein LZ30DRAFT_311029 [Colletotrichum cereale]|nr:hypothetical protein LZ30DRAFT_311029 [Colletotrichum cereale]